MTSMAMQLQVPVLEKPTRDEHLITGEELADMSDIETAELQALLDYIIESFMVDSVD